MKDLFDILLIFNKRVWVGGVGGLGGGGGWCRTYLLNLRERTQYYRSDDVQPGNSFFNMMKHPSFEKHC